jgi:hypothetical protein
MKLALPAVKFPLSRIRGPLCPLEPFVFLTAFFASDGFLRRVCFQSEAQKKNKDDCSRKRRLAKKKIGRKSFLSISPKILCSKSERKAIFFAVVVVRLRKQLDTVP